MKSNSKKRSGFGLIEVIISVAIIGIIIFSVYDGYIIIINQTKAGQVKQTSTLIGKQISEEIKSVSEDREITTSGEEGNLILELTDKIHLNENGDNYEVTQYYNEDGNLTDSADKYKAEISLVPREVNGKLIAIGEASNSENIYITKESGQVKPVNNKVSDFQSIEDDVTINIEIDDSAASKIKIGSNVLDYSFKDEKPQINLNLENCMGKVTISVNIKQKLR